MIGAIGERELLATLPLEGFAGVEQVLPILKPYKLVSRELSPDPTVIEVRGRRIGDGYFGFIAGPCTVETREQTLETARAVAAEGVTMLRGGAFKPRTSPYAFQGLGDEALEILKEARSPGNRHRGRTRERRRDPPLPRRRLPRTPHPDRRPPRKCRDPPARTALTGRARHRLEAAVARDSERLGRLVDDLLGLARLEAHPNRAPIDLAAIMGPLVEDARLRAPRATIRASSWWASSLGRRVRCSRSGTPSNAVEWTRSIRPVPSAQKRR